MRKILVVFGTRPEVIKMAPLIFALREKQGVQVVTCATAQHRELLDQVLNFFTIVPDIDLALMRKDQTLGSLTARCITSLVDCFGQEKPDFVLVQGDTTTAYTAALAAFYQQVPIGHVEAGLRTSDKYSPFPEEVNRRMISVLADLHFAPTLRAEKNLRAENIPAVRIHRVGNTGIDALLWASTRCAAPADLLERVGNRKLILLTLHRRESFGAPIREIMTTVRDFLKAVPDCHVVYPVHPNPNVGEAAREILGGVNNLSLVAPLPYGEMVALLKRCQFVMTDSGGLQEEAPTFGRPVMVLRDTTERPEAIEAGCARLVGHQRSAVLELMKTLADPNSELYRSMAKVKNPFGDGTAARQIAQILLASASTKAKAA